MKRQTTNLFDEIGNKKNFSCEKHDFGISISRNLKKKEVIISAQSLFLVGSKIEKNLNSLLKNELKSTFKINKAKNILIVGLGNREVGNDALGPKTIEKLLISRGLELSPSVCAIAPNVQANTGIETFEIVKAISKIVSPDLVIVVDALATNSISRLCCCFQISENGISAGSGNGRLSKKISKSSLKVGKVLTIGVPTLIYASSIANEISNPKLKNQLRAVENLMLSPTDVEKSIETLSKIISKALNETLFPSLLPSEIETIVR